MNKYTLLTGASSGIGLEYAHVLAANGHNLLLVARRKERLDELKNELCDKYQINCLILPLDLTEPDSHKQIRSFVKEKNVFINCIINNAGMGLFEYLHKMNEDQIRKLMYLNMQAPTLITREFLPEMLEKGEGAIQFIASIAGYLPTPLYSIYGATKAYLKNFGISLHYELKETPIKVNVLNPGVTKTEFFKKANQNNSWVQRVQMMSAKRCAEISYTALKKNKDSVLPGFINNYTVYVLLKFTPLFLQARMIMQDLMKSNERSL
tara:strand:+ start:8311 stop:9105 length:795 start_codon:yes stop_codon:yes gene_type:complete